MWGESMHQQGVGSSPAPAPAPWGLSVCLWAVASRFHSFTDSFIHTRLLWRMCWALRTHWWIRPASTLQGCDLVGQAAWERVAPFVAEKAGALSPITKGYFTSRKCWGVLSLNVRCGARWGAGKLEKAADPGPSGLWCHSMELGGFLRVIRWSLSAYCAVCDLGSFVCLFCFCLFFLLFLWGMYTECEYI